VTGGDEFYASAYPEIGAGGFTRLDGTVQFFVRVNALLRQDMTVLDFGAGRGAPASADATWRRSLANLKGKVATVIGADRDSAVLENPTIDRAVVLEGDILPFDDESIDLVVADHVFEHLSDPTTTASELRRVLKPGGWLCARTPYGYSLMVLASSLIPNRLHAKTVMQVQPGSFREERDVFPTIYKLNTFGSLRRHFPTEAWRHHSYTWSPEPSYHFGKAGILRLLMSYQWLKRPFGGEVLNVFLRKRERR
jgi:SAM-dependent methyltransferase